MNNIQKEQIPSSSLSPELVNRKSFSSLPSSVVVELLQGSPVSEHWHKPVQTSPAFLHWQRFVEHLVLAQAHFTSCKIGLYGLCWATFEHLFKI